MIAANLPHLNSTELAILKVLWTDGRKSAREVHDCIGNSLGWAASTTRTTLERMVKKGLLGKESFHGLRLYVPAVTRAAGFAGMIRDFADKVLEGPVTPVVSLIADAGALSPDELAELRSLVEEGEEAGE